MALIRIQASTKQAIFCIFSSLAQFGQWPLQQLDILRFYLTQLYSGVDAVALVPVLFMYQIRRSAKDDTYGKEQSRCQNALLHMRCILNRII